MKPNNPSVTEASVLPRIHRGVRVNNTTAMWQSRTVLQQWANTLQNNSSVYICYDMQTMSNSFYGPEIATNCGSTEQFVYLLQSVWSTSEHRLHKGDRERRVGNWDNTPQKGGTEVCSPEDHWWNNTIKCNLDESTSNTIKCNLDESTSNTIKCNLDESTSNTIKCNLDESTSNTIKCRQKPSRSKGAVNNVENLWEDRGTILWRRVN